MAIAMEIETPIQQGGAPFTAADLDDRPDDGRRYEIIDGVLIVSPAPRRLHQRAVTRLLVLLDAACPPEWEVLPAPFDVLLAEDTLMQPDVVVARRDDYTDKNLPVPPLLAVEVLSPGTRLIDLHVKRERCERAGVPSFWVVDPVKDPTEARLIVWQLDADGRYQQVAEVTGGEAYQADKPFPVRVVPADLVRG